MSREERAGDGMKDRKKTKGEMIKIKRDYCHKTAQRLEANCHAAQKKQAFIHAE